jgi:osmotically-inducible protein OsmY
MTAHTAAFDAVRVPRDPREIEDEVREALRSDRRIGSPHLIAVSADMIGTVELRGAVENLPERRAAVRDARRIDGVFEVIAHLAVHPLVTGSLGDDAIRAAALEELESAPHILARHVEVSVDEGWVTLTGFVRHDAQKARAAEDVARLDGVTSVTNRITVR